MAAGNAYDRDHPYDWLIGHHKPDLIQLVTNKPDPLFRELFSVIAKPNGGVKGQDGRTGFRIDFAELQRMKLRKLQIKLIRHVAAMVRDGREPTKPDGVDDDDWTDWEDDLKEYIKAVQDYDFMIDSAEQANNPFIASSVRRVDHKILAGEMDAAGIHVGSLLRGADGGGGDGRRVTIRHRGRWDAHDEPIWGWKYPQGVRDRVLERVPYVSVANIFILVPSFLIIFTTLFFDSSDDIAARVAPFLVVLGSVILWGLGLLFNVKQIKDVIPMTAGYTAVLTLILNGAATLRQPANSDGTT